MVESPGKMYALATVLTLLAILAIILRFWARRVKKVRPSWDDYLIVLALVLPYVTSGFWVEGLRSHPFLRSPPSAQESA